MSATEKQQRDFEPVPIHQNRFVKRLIGTSWLGPGSVFAGSFVIYVLIPAVWAFRDGTLVASKGVDALLTAHNGYVFAIPLVLAAIAAYYRDTCDVLDQLMGCKTLERNAPALLKVVADAKRVPWSRALSTALTIIAIVTPTLFLVNRHHAAAKTWLFSDAKTPRLLAFYFVPLFHGLVIYIIASWVLLHLRASVVLRKIFKLDGGSKLKLVILHPDKCMGLGPIGDMINSVTAVLISIGFVFFTWQIGVFYSDWGGPTTLLARIMGNLGEIQTQGMGKPTLSAFATLGAWIGFFTFSPLVFFLPLTSAKQTMAALKKAKLQELGARIADSTNIDQTPELFKQYRQVQKARVWPFNVNTVTSFGVAMGTPVALTILEEIAKRAAFG